MPPKIPGKLNEPPSEAEFNALRIAAFCRSKGGIFYRLHPTNRSTGDPWHPVFFSTRGTTRFDPENGVGTLYVAQSLAGAILEKFDDRWGPVGSIERTLTRAELDSWWVTLIDLAPAAVFSTRGSNLSKIGTDAQLLTGDYAIARQWALRLMNHPDKIGGIAYASRHAYSRGNLAIFLRDGLRPESYDANLGPANKRWWRREAGHGIAIVHGPQIKLAVHPQLKAILTDLEVGVL